MRTRNGAALAVLLLALGPACNSALELPCEGPECVEPCAGDGGTCETDAGPETCDSGSCEALAAVTGRIVAHDSGLAIGGAQVIELGGTSDTSTDTAGLFRIDVAANTADLRLEVRAGKGYPTHQTRQLDVGAADYELDGLATEAHLILSSNLLSSLLDDAGLSAGPRTAVVARVGRLTGVPLGAARVSLQPSSGVTVYFAGFNEPDPTRTFTSGASGLVVIVGVAPGTYALSGVHQQATSCVGAGSDGAATIDLVVSEDTITNAGWLVCNQ